MPWLIAFFLLVRAGVPMLAVAAAHARGVGVAEVCPVYGVALPAPLLASTAVHGAMPQMDGGAGEHRHGAMLADAENQGGGGSHDHREHHQHHGELAAGHDHCALTLLLGAAAPAVCATAVVGAIAAAEPRQQSTSSATPLHDETLAWYARDAHPPPG